MAEVLLVGTATRGRKNVVVRPSGPEELVRYLGGRHVERLSLTPEASSVTLAYEPLGLPSAILDASTRNWVYSPSVSGNIFSFANIGGTGMHILEVYYTPNLGTSDLYLAASRFLQTTGEVPYVCRVGGKPAALEMEDWHLEAVEPGGQFNGATVEFSSTGMSLSGMAPKFRDRVLEGSGPDLASKLNTLADMGLVPFYAARWGLTNPAGSGILSGGEDGRLGEEEIDFFMEAADIPGEVTHVVFLTECTSGMMDAAVRFGRETTRPLVFLFAAPGYVGPVEDYVEHIRTALPFRSDLVGLVLGRILTTIDGQPTERLAVEGVGAALYGMNTGNVTNLPVAAHGFAPKLKEEELDTLKRAGVICVTRHIGNDIASYQGVTSANIRSFLYTSKLSEIYGIAWASLKRYLGRHVPTQSIPAIEDDLRTALEGVAFFETVNVVVSIPLGLDKMYARIEGILEREILNITFQFTSV